jgi:hypothetical protein
MVVESAVTTTRRAGRQVLRPDAGERPPGLLGDHLPTRERGHIAKVLDAPMAEPRGAHGHGLQRAVLVVVDEHAERRPVDLLREDHERARRLHHLVQRGHELLRLR